MRLPPAGWMTGSATPKASTRLRNTSTACDNAPLISGVRETILFVPLSSAFGQAIGVHLHEERRAALQIQAQLDLARRIALQLVQNVGRRIKLIRGVDEREITLDVVRADGVRQIGELAVGPRLSNGVNRSKMFVNAASLFSAREVNSSASGLKSADRSRKATRRRSG